MKRKTLPFRLYAQILIFSGLIALGALILLPMQQAIHDAMTGIRDEMITMLEEEIDRKIRYSSISPSFFGSFDVRNISISGEDNHPVLSISRFRITYSLLDFFRGRTQLIRSIQIDTPYIDFNTVRDNDLLNLFENIGKGRENLSHNLTGMIPEQLVVRIRNGKCQITSGNETIDFDSLNLSMEIIEEKFIINGGWMINVTANMPTGEPVSIQFPLEMYSTFETNLDNGEGAIIVESIYGDVRSANEAHFAVNINNGSINIRNIYGVDQIAFSLGYVFDDGRFSARLECRDFRLGEFLSFSGALENFSQMLDVTTSGLASFEKNNDGTMDYSVNLAGAIPPGRFSASQSAQPLFVIDTAGDEQGMIVNNVRFAMPGTWNDTRGSAAALFYGDMSFNGTVDLNPIAPSGTLSLGNFSLSGSESINADFAVTHRDGDILFFSPAVKIGQGSHAVELTSFNALLQPGGQNFDIAVSANRPGHTGGRGAVRHGSFSLDGSVDNRLHNISANLNLNSFTASDLIYMALPFINDFKLPAPLDGLLRNTAITTEVSFSTDFTAIQYNAPRINFTVGSGRENLMGSIALSGTNRQFNVNGGSLAIGNEVMLISGYAGITSGNALNFSVNANYRDLAYLIQGSFNDGSSVNVQGSYGFNLNLGMIDGYTGSMQADGFPVPFIGTPAFLSLSTQFNVNSADSWSIDLEQFELQNLAPPLGSPLGPIRLAGTGRVDQSGIRFPSLNYNDRFGTLGGTADILWPTGHTGYSMTVTAGQGRENYHVQAAIANQRLEISLSGSSMRLERVFDKLGSILVDGNANLSWDSADSFHAECNFVSVSGNIQGREFRANGRAALDNEKLSIGNMQLYYAGYEAVVSQLSIDSANGIGSTGIALNGAVGNNPVNGNFEIGVNFQPVLSLLHIGDTLQSFSGNITISDFWNNSQGEPASSSIAFSHMNGNITVSGGERGMFRLQADEDGNFFAGLASPSPVRGTIAGNIKHNTINARCSDLYVDAAALFDMLPINSDVQFAGGFVTASFDIRGLITDPEFFGTARGTSLRLRIPDYITQDLRPIPFNVAIEGNEMHFGPVPTAVGNGAGTASGWFRIDRWIPNTFFIDITVPQDTPIPYGYDFAGFTAHGNASGNLALFRESMRMEITGELLVNNSELGINSEEITRAQGQDIYSRARIPNVVNLAITTGPVVEFFYPNSRFPLLRATPDMGTKILVTADSLTQQFSLTSDVRIRSGEIFYFERSFFIRSGTLIFRENEMRFDPRLTARAEVRDRTEDGPVTISMIVDNAPLLSFTARFESSPTLSQVEILALMGQSITGTQVADGDGQRAFLGSAMDVAQVFLVRRFESQIRNFLQLDLFSFRTQFFQNLLLPQTGNIQSPVDRTGEVGNYFDNTTIFGGKYIGQDMFIQGMLSMSYDENRTTWGGMVFRPDIGLELQNPWFSIRWDFTPMHPENWFINDNSITLTKSWSF
ncbi:MAG: translocation/assembly module TamB [Treponema sp.]|nr:translocation/assembly module TamB [Treponema sp.]